MDRPVIAESRTVELPAIVLHENDPDVLEYWVQPFAVDLVVKGQRSGRTRIQHTPDQLLITRSGFRVEEWREEKRLLLAAADNPQRFYKDDAGRWHHVPAEEYFAALNIEYRLRSADELPRIYIANLHFLEDFSRDDAPDVPADAASAILSVVNEKKIVPHLSLVHEFGFKSDHIFQLVLRGDVYVDLHQQRLDQVEDLLLFRSEAIQRAHALSASPRTQLAPACELLLKPGARFSFDSKLLEVVLVGASWVIARNEDGSTSNLPIELVERLFREASIDEATRTRVTTYDVNTVIASDEHLAVAIRRLEAIRNPDTSQISERSLRRFRSAIEGVSSVQEQLKLLAPRRVGNTKRRLPQPAIDIALEIIEEHHNKPKRQPVSASYEQYKARCVERDVRPMSESAFYVWIKDHVDVTAREGKRAAYQQEPIPLWYDHEHPVHGVRPHEVVYIDHTVVNQLCRGMEIQDLGKPVLTLAFDGAVGKARAMYLSYDSPSANTVLMVLRDYAIRNGRLPSMIVLDNGPEFHSVTLKTFCDLFRISIRWRRRSKPRDSALVERMLGVTEMEVIAALDGNTRQLKDPRMVSAEVQPRNFVRWTLTALHGSLEDFLFSVHPSREHPRFGVSPNDRERRLLVELGTREHVIVRYDETFRLLTSPHASTKPTRLIDRQRGVFVDGMYYWNECLAKASPNEEGEVRVEMWCARVVYVCFRGQWVIAQARDGGRLDGRFRHELEIAKRTENRTRRTRAQQARRSSKQSAAKRDLWEPEKWDPRLREQAVEAHYLYSKLGMTEALPEARSARAQELSLVGTVIAGAPKIEAAPAANSTPNAREAAMAGAHAAAEPAESSEQSSHRARAYGTTDPRPMAAPEEIAAEPETDKAYDYF